MAPVFISKNVYVSGYAGLVGGNHIKMTVMQKILLCLTVLHLIMANNFAPTAKDVPFDMCYTIEENIWKERRTIQLNCEGNPFWGKCIVDGS